MNSNLILYPLGTMGWIPSSDYRTTSFAFFWGTELIILDAGTGLSRLLDLRDTLFESIWPTLTRVRIFLSHYHLDHSSGLFWIKGIFGPTPITIYAPGMDIYGRTAQDILDGLFQKPYSPSKIRNFGPSISIEDLNLSGMTLDNGPIPLRIGVRHNPNHSDPSVSFRFGDLFAFVTDTPPEYDVIHFVRGVKVLLHESWLDSSGSFESFDDPLDCHREGPHTCSFGAGLIAVRADVNRLYLIHHNPERSMADAENDARKVSSKLQIDCRAAVDLKEITIKIG